MTSDPAFMRYQDEHQRGCLDLFDGNCPRYFAPQERADYLQFLHNTRDPYWVSIQDNVIVAAFGLSRTADDCARLSWILVSPTHQQQGIGTVMMTFVLKQAKTLAVREIKIAASQHSAPFFARFGAIEEAHTPHGWGPNMHRVDMRLALD